MKLIKPVHYQRNGFDLLDFFELIMPRSWVRGFYILNIIKYLFRFPHKNGKEDILKAGTYMDRFIKYEGADDETDATSTKN